jgi:hypothetical protein
MEVLIDSTGHCAIQWRSSRRHLRLYRSVVHVLPNRSVHCGNGICDPVVGGCVSLGECGGWSEVWTGGWVFRGMVGPLFLSPIVTWRRLLTISSRRWNFLGWLFGTASISSILANQVISMYGLFHEGYAYKRWHVFIAYLIMTWLSALIVMFMNRTLPTITKLGLCLILAGVFTTILVCAIMPSRTGKGYASNAFVWKEWENKTGWGSDGFVFIAGMLNGAFAVGTPYVILFLPFPFPPFPNIHLTQN